MRWLLYIVALSFVACGVEEHPDFLIGRQCIWQNDMPCDEGQECLPHLQGPSRFDDFRCRDRASIVNFPTGEGPLAFCDDIDHFCPGGLVCRPDRIRADGGPRPNVCKDPSDVFTPPTFDGGGGQ